MYPRPKGAQISREIPDMSTCANCGTALPPEAAFCPRCGTAVAASGAGSRPPAGSDNAAAGAAATAASPRHVAPPPRPATVPPPTRSAAAAGPHAAPPAREKKGRGWWIVPLAIIAIIIVAWLVLAGFPFGGDDTNVVRPSTTIAEGTAPRAPQGTIVEVPVVAEGTATGNDPTQGFGQIPAGEIIPPPNLQTQTVHPGAQPPYGALPPGQQVPQQTTQPPASPRQQQPAARPAPTQTTPAPRQTARQAPAPAAPPARQTPRTTAPPPQQRTERREEPAPARREPAESTTERGSDEITEGAAIAVLSNRITSHYRVPTNCLSIRSRGYRNAGYTFDVWDTCVRGGGSRRLDSWRVDSKTREVFRQRSDGRYLRP